MRHTRNCSPLGSIKFKSQWCLVWKWHGFPDVVGWLRNKISEYRCVWLAASLPLPLAARSNFFLARKSLNIPISEIWLPFTLRFSLGLAFKFGFLILFFVIFVLYYQAQLQLQLQLNWKLRWLYSLFFHKFLAPVCPRLDVLNMPITSCIVLYIPI